MLKGMLFFADLLAFVVVVGALWLAFRRTSPHHWARRAPALANGTDAFLLGGAAGGSGAPEVVLDIEATSSPDVVLEPDETAAEAASVTSQDPVSAHDVGSSEPVTVPPEPVTVPSAPPPAPTAPVPLPAQPPPDATPWLTPAATTVIDAEPDGSDRRLDVAAKLSRPRTTVPAGSDVHRIVEEPAQTLPASGPVEGRDWHVPPAPPRPDTAPISIADRRVRQQRRARSERRKAAVIVRSRGDEWVVERYGASRVSSIHPSRELAELKAARTARRDHVRLEVHGPDGRVVRQRDYTLAS
jgi:hypothetical protein